MRPATTVTLATRATRPMTKDATPRALLGLLAGAPEFGCRPKT
ncbi:hypothetical protein [Mycobacterium sp.]